MTDPTALEYPNVLAALLGRAPAEYGNLQYAIWAESRAARNSRVAVSIAMQNPFGYFTEYKIALSHYDPVWGGRRDHFALCKNAAVVLQPGECGLLKIPIWIDGNARTTIHDFEVSWYGFVCGLTFGARFKPVKRVHDKAPTETSVPAGVLANLMTAPMGLLVIPTGKRFILRIQVVEENTGGSKPPELVATFESIWAPGLENSYLEKDHNLVRAVARER